MLEAERQLAEQRELAIAAAASRAEAERAAEASRKAAEAKAEEQRLAELRRIEHETFLRQEAERLEAERREREQAVVWGDDAIGPACALDMAGLDEDLLDIFIEEGNDLLDHADGLTARLRAEPDDSEALVALRRTLHTLKGGARMAGVMAMGDLGHAIESLLESVAEARIQFAASDLSLIERSLDRMTAMLGRIGQRRAVHPADELVRELAGRAGGETVEIPGAGEPAQVPVELSELSSPIEPVDTHAVESRGQQEQVRVRADLLDRLVNYAGEVAIYRSRLEQQLGAFRGAMAEMEQTNTRLRDQLRRLDIETEAQIIARYQREQETADPAFDPLELDRFSTLQQLSRALGESANDLSSLQGSLEDLTRQYETLLQQQSRVSTELQEGLMRTRMVPVESVLPRLRRVVRQAGSDAGKDVQFVLDSAHGGELDRNVLERMLGPLEHLLRNAVAHGIEPPGVRTAAGKPATGEVRMKVRQDGSEVVLEVSDDGAGLNRDAIRRRAEARGLVEAGETLSDTRIDNLILVSGVSTVDGVNQLAGRGVGMDVVSSEVRQIGGSLEIASVTGRGSRFTLHLPQTLAVTQAVFVRIGESVYAVPVASVRGVSRIDRANYEAGERHHRYGGEDYLVHDLGQLLGLAPVKAEDQLQVPLVLVRSGDLRIAVGVDQVLGNREIVVKPTGPQVASIPGVFGATVMGDGRVMIILDIVPLARRHASRLAEGGAEAPVAAVKASREPLVMVVDDSITMRKVTGRVLTRQGFEVVTANDGIDALERMEERVPDLVLLDIEMPRMDGYELAAEMKRQAGLCQVPIMMITSRTGDKHRQRALDLGVDRYIGKPYQEQELLRNVNELLGTGGE
ncbi:hybrid sensor histidine kinase/response regulator [Lysobacter pythonis]|uniref:Chemotaxis protein CheA n=1 Tax=Solilutibacter pythonis TaxID=2483112 RepID=A0A3M2HV64_9GAMM|nr:hybrid sensor histidine kinase/response regulator [Lysobacter pythonis]